MFEILSTYSHELLLAVLLLMGLLVTILGSKLSTLEKRIIAIPHISLSESLSAAINVNQSSIENNRHAIEKALADIAQLQKEQKGSYTSFVHRYNPFRESGVGGNQSFSIALANAHGNGLLITSLYSREMNRVSSKPLINWTNEEYTISPEEQFAIDAVKKNLL